MPEDIRLGEAHPPDTKIGGYLIAEEEIELNAGRVRRKLVVKNTGDRPVQVGSHFHFFEVNRALDFDRPAALGMHLNIPAGSAVRFEPGTAQEVEVTEYAGQRHLHGFNGLCNGGLVSFRVQIDALERARRYGFKGAEGGSGL